MNSYLYEPILDTTRTAGKSFGEIIYDSYPNAIMADSPGDRAKWEIVFSKLANSIQPAINMDLIGYTGRFIKVFGDDHKKIKKSIERRTGIKLSVKLKWE